MRANARAPFPEPFGPTSRPRGLLERDTGDGSEPGRTSRTYASSDLPASREAPGRTAVGFLSDVGCWQVFGLASISAFAAFLRPPLPSSEEPVLVVDVALAYRCGAAPEFPPGSPFKL
jgi:hypothetical protein